MYLCRLNHIHSSYWCDSEIKKIDEGTTINRYVRVHNTIGGSSTPTINAIVDLEEIIKEKE
ncbi:MAG: hypothetical protein CM15mV92_330 [Caudoviricetes sp.]|nr:MAG: hypothetical protein CM15mV92_330 [Caudoviricetes sp.]